MIPGAGLYLPETLYSKQTDVSEPRERRATRRNLFDRRPSSSQDQNTSDRESIAMSNKSTEDVTRVFSSLATVFDFADFASTYGKVSSENGVFVNLIQRVRQDVTEASRLYTSQAVTDFLESWPDKKTWIDVILLDVQRALNDIGLYMETVRIIGDDGGTAGLRRRFEWILSHHKKLISKQQYLTLCHSSLMATVQIMQTAEINSTLGGQDPIYEAPATPWLRDEGKDILRGPHSRQRWRMSQKNLSLPSIHISNAEIDKVEAHPINSVLAELPGSTPDDLQDPNNMDLYTSPRQMRTLSVDGTSQEDLDQEMANRPGVEETVDTDIVAIARPAQLLRRRLRPISDSVRARRSFDQVQASKPSAHEITRASLDYSRPRAYSDQSRSHGMMDARPRASFDQIRTLPTLSEKPLERYDSSASVAVEDAASVALTGPRSRPKAVQVKKPPPRHRSLPSPSQLPCLSSQISLLDELSHWVLPNPMRDSLQSYHSVDTSTSLEASTPGTSVASSPILPNSSTNSPTIPAERATIVDYPKPSNASIASRTSSIARKPLPTGADIHIVPPKPNPDPLETEEATDEPNSHILPQTALGQEPALRSAESSETTLQRLPSETSNVVHHSDTGNPTGISEAAADPKDPSPQAEPSPSTLPTPTPSITEPSPSVSTIEAPSNVSQDIFETQTPQPDILLSESVANDVTTDSSKPSHDGENASNEPEPKKELASAVASPRMTAQAKRRAAHARRMQIAFGT